MDTAQSLKNADPPIYAKAEATATAEAMVEITAAKMKTVIIALNQLFISIFFL